MTAQIAVKNNTDEEIARKAKIKQIISTFGPLFGFVGILLL